MVVACDGTVRGDYGRLRALDGLAGPWGVTLTSPAVYHSSLFSSVFLCSMYVGYCCRVGVLGVGVFVCE